MLHSIKSFIRIIINIYQRSFSAALTEGQIIQRPVEVQLHFSAVNQRRVQSKSPLCTLPEVLLYWSPPENVVQTFSHVHHLALRFGSCSKHKYILFFVLYFGSELVPQEEEHTPLWAVEVQVTPARGLLYPQLSHFRIPLSCGWFRQSTVILPFSIQHTHISLSQNLSHIILENLHSYLTSRGRLHIWST